MSLLDSAVVFPFSLARFLSLAFQGGSLCLLVIILETGYKHKLLTQVVDHASCKVLGIQGH